MFVKALCFVCMCTTLAWAMRVPVASVDAGNGARALDQALVTVLADIVRWVNTGR